MSFVDNVELDSKTYFVTKIPIHSSVYLIKFAFASNAMKFLVHVVPDKCTTQMF